MQKEQKKPKWHLIYYALAAIAILAVGSGLYLSHKIMGIYSGSVEYNQVWAHRVSALTELNGLAQKTNAPGNDVFDTKQVARERATRNAALKTFDASHKAICDDLKTIANPVDRELLLGKMDQVKIDMAAMVAEADQIFTSKRTRFLRFSRRGRIHAPARAWPRWTGNMPN